VKGMSSLLPRAVGGGGLAASAAAALLAGHDIDQRFGEIHSP